VSARTFVLICVVAALTLPLAARAATVPVQPKHHRPVAEATKVRQTVKGERRLCICVVIPQLIPPRALSREEWEREYDLAMFEAGLEPPYGTIGTAGPDPGISA